MNPSPAAAATTVSRGCGGGVGGCREPPLGKKKKLNEVGIRDEQFHVLTLGAKNFFKHASSGCHAINFLFHVLYSQ